MCTPLKHIKVREHHRGHCSPAVTELRPSGLGTCDFTHGAISPAPTAKPCGNGQQFFDPRGTVLGVFSMWEEYIPVIREGL